MPVTWNWHNDQRTILYFTFQDPWTLEEFTSVDFEARQAIKELNHSVDAIVDLSHTKSVPRNIVSGLVNMAKRNEPEANMGSSVVIHATPMLKTFIQVVQQLVPPDTLHLAEGLAGAEHTLSVLQTGNNPVQSIDR